MKRIQQVSRYMLILLKLLIIVIPLFTVFLWFFPHSSQVSSGDTNSLTIWSLSLSHTPVDVVTRSDISHWSPLQKLLGFSSDLAGTIPLIIGLLLLHSLFRNYY
ncbi:MAG: hypothetical protein ACRC5A_05790 [Enterobacteriaceae bacterium]